LKLKKFSILNIYDFHQEYFKLNIYIKKKRTYKIQLFTLYMHKKLQYFNILYKDKFYNFSNGNLLSQKLKSIKFFRKSKKSISTNINVLNKKFQKNLSNIFFFLCKNFNFRHYIWIKKFFKINQPKINFFIITHNWNYVQKKKKRIKKKIWKNLLKNSKEI